MARLSSLLLLVLAAVSSTSAGTVEKRQSDTFKAAAGSRYFGAALAVGNLNGDATFKRLAQQQFSGATAENEMKWDATEPNPGQFTFTNGDTIANFAKQQGQLFRGHTLVWHNQLPSFMQSISGASNVQTAMTRHINGLMSHYKGQFLAWDVVNEAFNDDGSLRSSVFSRNLGSNFIDLAFQTARAADPSVKLYINDFNTEGVNAKSNALLTTVQRLKSKNIIDGVGFQSHFIVGQVPRDLQTNLQRFANVGVDVALTELDIRMPTPASQANLNQQATDYANVVNACQAVSRCVGITIWGITDLHSWVPGTFSGQGAALPFDNNGNPKPAFNSIITALRT